jgi:hypothetical protein
MPPWGGALLIIAGLINIAGGIAALTRQTDFNNFFNITSVNGSAYTGGPLIFIGVITLIGGIVGVMRMVWGLALAGGILAILPSPGWIFGVPGLILIAMSKPEFNYRRVLEAEGKVIAAPAQATPTMQTGPMQPAAMPTAGRMSVQGYLTGLDYPANKNELSIFAKSNGAPAQVMMYMNKLPNREYKSPVDLEDEFSKIK